MNINAARRRRVFRYLNSGFRFTSPGKTQVERDYDARVAAAFPSEWKAAESLVGSDRRQTRRLLRRKYDRILGE